MLEVRKNIDTGTLIDLIATGLPNSVSDRIDRESIKETKDLYNELGKLEHLVETKKVYERKIDNTTKNKTEKTPCKICEKKI